MTVLGPDGTFHGQFGLESKTKLASRDLAFPQGLAITKGGTVFVADSGHGRVVVFAPASASGGGVGSGGASGSWTWVWFTGAGLCATVAAVLLERLRRRRASRIPAVAAPLAPAPAASSPALAPSSAPASTPVVSRRTLIAGATVLTGAARPECCR